MSGRYGIKLLAIIAALLALVLLAGVGTAMAAPPSEMTTIVYEVANCENNSKVATLGTSESCSATLTYPRLAFGDFVDPYYGCGREHWRGFLQFPLDEIPTHARIVDAELSVYVWMAYPPPLLQGSVEDPVTIGVHRVTEDWDQGSLVWPGPAYTPPAKWQTIADIPALYTWDVKQIVKAWARGKPNYGFAFVTKKEGRNSSVFAAFPDCYSFPPPGQGEAYLTVTYVNPPGRR